MDGIYLPDVMERLGEAARNGNVAEVERLTEKVKVHARFRRACIQDVRRITANATAHR